MKTGASIAQLVEHPLRKRQVVCSNPTWGFLLFCFFLPVSEWSSFFVFE